MQREKHKKLFYIHISASKMTHTAVSVLSFILRDKLQQLEMFCSAKVVIGCNLWWKQSPWIPGRADNYWNNGNEFSPQLVTSVGCYWRRLCWWERVTDAGCCRVCPVQKDKEQILSVAPVVVMSLLAAVSLLLGFWTPVCASPRFKRLPGHWCVLGLRHWMQSPRMH